MTEKVVYNIVFSITRAIEMMNDCFPRCDIRKIELSDSDFERFAHDAYELVRGEKNASSCFLTHVAGIPIRVGDNFSVTNGYMAVYLRARDLNWCVIIDFAGNTIFYFNNEIRL